MKGRPFRGLVVNALLAASVGSLLSAPGVSAANLITDLSCPSTSLCVALPANGNAVEVANPLVHSRWTENLVDSEGGLLQSISCPSVGFCAAVDLRGNLVTSSRPGDPTAPWRLAHIDGPFTGKSVELEGVSCPSAGLCVAVDNVGNVLSSQAPGSGPRAWHAAHIEGANEFDAVTCAPSSSVCVAVDVNGTPAEPWRRHRRPARGRVLRPRVGSGDGDGDGDAERRLTVRDGYGRLRLRVSGALRPLAVRNHHHAHSDAGQR